MDDAVSIPPDRAFSTLKERTDSYFMYVVHSRIEEYEALGWVNTGVLKGTHHGFYSELMEWKGEGEPKEPDHG